MKEFKFHVPVDGLLSISICADDVKEALEILLDKKDDGSLSFRKPKIAVVDNG